MKIRFTKNRLLILLLSISLSLLMFVSQSFAGDIFYVYKDKAGLTHIEDYIPGELVKYGYKIVNDRGMTIKEVPSVASKLKKDNAKKRRAEKRRAKAEQKKRNQILLRRFTSLEDIRETGNKKILALQSQIDLTLSHIKAYKENLSDLEGHAEKLTKKNQPVPDKQVNDIKSMKDSINKNNKYIGQRKIEQRKIREEFIVFIREYKKLLAKK